MRNQHRGDSRKKENDDPGSTDWRFSGVVLRFHDGSVFFLFPDEIDDQVRDTQTKRRHTDPLQTLRDVS